MADAQNILIEKIMEQNFRILYQECSSYPVLKAFVKFLDLFQLVGNQNQIVPPGQWIEWTWWLADEDIFTITPLKLNWETLHPLFNITNSRWCFVKIKWDIAPRRTRLLMSHNVSQCLNIPPTCFNVSHHQLKWHWKTLHLCAPTC